MSSLNDNVNVNNADHDQLRRDLDELGIDSRPNPNWNVNANTHANGGAGNVQSVSSNNVVNNVNNSNNNGGIIQHSSVNIQSASSVAPYRRGSPEYEKYRESLRKMRKAIEGEQYKFKDNESDYCVWTFKMRRFLRREGIDIDLSGAITQQGIADTSDKSVLEQSVVFNMLCDCVPDEASHILTGLPDEQQTAYHAWNALQVHYIGNVENYKQKLETRFGNLEWNEGDEFNQFIKHFDELNAQMRVVGTEKSEIGKKNKILTSALMKRDKARRNIHQRLKIIDTLHSEKPFNTWMSEIRKEIEQIEEEARHIISKKPSSTSSSSPSSSSNESHEASFANARRGGFNAGGNYRGGRGGGGMQGRGGVCYNFMNEGSCRFGNNCRFRHVINNHSTPSTNSNNNNNANNNAPTPSNSNNNNNPSNKVPCQSWSRFKDCQYGSECKFMHNMMTVTEHECNLSEMRSEEKFIYADTCASANMTNDERYMKNMRELSEKIVIKSASGEMIHAVARGEGNIELANGKMFVTTNMLYVPGLCHTLISIGDIESNDHYKVEGDHLVQKDERGEETNKIAIEKRNNLWMIRVAPENSNETAFVTTRAQAAKEKDDNNNVDQQNIEDKKEKDIKPDEISIENQSKDEKERDETPKENESKDEKAREEKSTDSSTSSQQSAEPMTSKSIDDEKLMMHARLGHIGEKLMMKLIKSGVTIDGKDLKFMKGFSCDQCAACSLAKMKRKKFDAAYDHHVNDVNDEISCDVMGPFIMREKEDERGWYRSGGVMSSVF